jgi:hypothetical protein
MDQKKRTVFSLDVSKIGVLSAMIAAVAVSSLVTPQSLAAAGPDTGEAVTFTAQGTFAATPVSGNDTLQLAGQPFTITIVARSSKLPTEHGRNSAIFSPLKMTGTVYSGLEPNEPIPISSSKAVIAQVVGASQDIFQAGFPYKILGIDLEAVAYITMPGGTLSTALIRPFSSVALDPTNATITYSNNTAATVLAVQSGTLTATAPAGGAEK